MEYISVGKILNFHGIKGEAKVGFSNESLIAKLKTVYIGEKKQEFKVTSIRFHKNFAILKFEKIDSINDLIEFKGQNIYLIKEKVTKNLDKNEFLVDDLIGMNVFDNEENIIGKVTEIQTTKANDILGVKMEGKKELVLIPFVSEIVPIVDIESNKIIVKPIEGLL